MQRSVADTGAAFVGNDVGRAEDVKRFATLNLAVPMKVSADGRNLPRAHVVFSAKGHVCTPASKWRDQEEVAKYHPDVDVSFQANVRCDVCMCIRACGRACTRVRVGGCAWLGFCVHGAVRPLRASET